MERIPSFLLKTKLDQFIDLPVVWAIDAAVG